jgi:predicted nucleic acid-binding protein
VTAFVLDCSVAVAWCFEDEATPESDGLLARLADETAAVPSIWRLELGNVLVLAERHGRITTARLTDFLASLADLSITIDDSTSTRALHEILSFARAERLTTYDAAYLELAMRLGIPVATRDRGLTAAATRLGTTVIGS